jgi:hypothetical protein
MSEEQGQNQVFTKRQQFLVAAHGGEIAKRICVQEGARILEILGAEAALALQNHKDNCASESDYTAICAAFFAKTYPADKASERNPDIMRWVMDRYLNETHNGKPILVEDLYKIGNAVQYFNGLKSTRSLPANDNVTDYTSLEAVRKRLDPYSVRRAKKAQERLERRMSPEVRAQIMAETSVLYSGKAGDIVMPHTVAASQYWGNNTEWCLSGEKNGPIDFPYYNRQGPVLMLLPKGEGKMALVKKLYYNANDKKRVEPDVASARLLTETFTQASAGIGDFIKAHQPASTFAPAHQPASSALSASPDPVLDPPLLEDELKWVNAIAQGYLFSGITRLPSDVKQSERIFLAALSRNGMVLEYAIPKFQKNLKMVQAAAKQSFFALQFADQSIKACPIAMLDFVRQDGDALQYAAGKLKADKNIVLAAVKQRGTALKYADPALRANPEIALAAVEQSGKAFELIHASLYGHRDIMLAAVRKNGDALLFAAPALRRDGEVVLEAVRHDATALRNAFPELRADKEIALAAIKKSGQAFEYIDPSLYGDRDIILTAVRKNGYFLRSADRVLQADKEVVLAAVLQNGEALQYAHPALQKDGILASYALDQAERHPEAVLQIRDFNLSMGDITDEDILAGQIRALESLLDQGKDDIARDHLRFIKPLWGQVERITGNPREQLEYLKSLPAPHAPDSHLATENTPLPG